MNGDFQSWGRFPRASQTIKPIFWRHEPLPPDFARSFLPYGLGRSYGDVCLNDGGTLIPVRGLNRFIRFDRAQGILRCEAGVSLSEIIDLTLPAGWFLPVTPGTRLVTVGGAIANDVHGKNHHRAGSFGGHVLQFELLRSDGSRLICSPDENRDYFCATVGGLGLTGLITWAEIRLIPVQSSRIAVRTIRFDRLERFFELSEEMHRGYEYTVAWIDSMARGKSLGRGLFMAGNHLPGDGRAGLVSPSPKSPVRIPIDMPGFVLNRFSLRLFNDLYYRRQIRRVSDRRVDFDSFFYPLDCLDDWNRLYGRRGLLQYQCLVPHGNIGVMRKILETISRSGEGSFLTVMKIMGAVPSLGMLSFAGPGVTLALDFPVTAGVLDMCRKLDAIVLDCGGRLYPAKDARMSAPAFQTFYPRWREFAGFIDPAFSSSFWRRVTVQSGERK